MVIGRPELLAVVALLLTLAAEALHARRVRRLARLAFGPGSRPAPWVRFVPVLRAGAAGALVWGLATLLALPPKVHLSEALPDNKKGHLMLVLDVSPSMRLEDAGPERKQPRMGRSRDVMESFFARVPIDQYLLSVVAVYNGAKPVVVDTKDMDVIANILGDLPMHQAFPSGKTDLFAGLEEAAKTAKPWQPRSTVVVLLTDGDTVPATGMPAMPASVRDVLVVGIGDPKAGSFIDGRQSRQDAATLRQVAARLKGTYHNGNEKHLPTELLHRLTVGPATSPFDRLSLREYALLASALGASVLAFLPLLLHEFGTRWRPGVPVAHDRSWGRGEPAAREKAGVA
jgi:Ca-activated chloride channel family protein